MENQKVKKVFRSRISVLLLGVLLAIFMPCIIPIIKSMIIPGLWIMGGTFMFIVFLFSGMRYVIAEDKLYLKIWFIFTCGLKITDIASVKRSYYLFDIPINTTASFKKLRLQFVRGTTYSYIHVSPVREQEFIEELKKVNPNIYVSFYNKKGIGCILDWDI